MEEPAGLRPYASLDADAADADGEGVWAVGPEEIQDTAQQCPVEVSQVLEGLEARDRGQGRDHRAFHLARL
jgi:hypothetical protein